MVNVFVRYFTKRVFSADYRLRKNFPVGVRMLSPKDLVFVGLITGDEPIITTAARKYYDTLAREHHFK